MQRENNRRRGTCIVDFSNRIKRLAWRQKSKLELGNFVICKWWSLILSNFVKREEKNFAAVKVHKVRNYYVTWVFSRLTNWSFWISRDTGRDIRIIWILTPLLLSRFPCVALKLENKNSEILVRLFVNGSIEGIWTCLHKATSQMLYIKYWKFCKRDPTQCN